MKWIWGTNGIKYSNEENYSPQTFFLYILWLYNPGYRIMPNFLQFSCSTCWTVRLQRRNILIIPFRGFFRQIWGELQRNALNRVSTDLAYWNSSSSRLFKALIFQFSGLTKKTKKTSLLVRRCWKYLRYRYCRLWTTCNWGTSIKKIIQFFCQKGGIGKGIYPPSGTIEEVAVMPRR